MCLHDHVLMFLHKKVFLVKSRVFEGEFSLSITRTEVRIRQSESLSAKKLSWAGVDFYTARAVLSGDGAVNQGPQLLSANQIA